MLIVLLDDRASPPRARSEARSTPVAERLAARPQVQPLPHDGALLADAPALLTGRTTTRSGWRITEIATSAPGYNSIRPNTRAARRDAQAERLLDRAVRQVPRGAGLGDEPDGAVRRVANGGGASSTSTASSAARRTSTRPRSIATRSRSSSPRRQQYGTAFAQRIALLIFSPNGGKPAGPYFNSDTSKRGYNGIYPSNAVALNSGAVIVLYYAKTQTRDGLKAELGVMRAGASDDPALTQSVIAYPSMDVLGACSNFDNGSLAYDQVHNKLFVIYTDGCGVDARLMLAASENEGRSWSKVSVISLAKAANGRVYSPSLTVISERVLGLLWEDGPSSPRWFFSKIENGTLSDPAVLLSAGSVKPEISNDSLWTSISQSDDASASGSSKATKTSIKVNVITMLNALWRTQGTLLANGKVLAIWSSGSSEGMSLFFGVMDMDDSRSIARPSDDSTLEDVTRNILLVYGGERGETGQYFDQENKTLKICASLRNRGQFAIRTPIELRLEDIHSDWGPISVAGATRPLKENGADWDISDSLTGDRIPPGTSSDPFCMAFRVNTQPEKRSPIDVNLLSFSLSIFARRETHRDLSGETVQPHR